MKSFFKLFFLFVIISSCSKKVVTTVTDFKELSINFENRKLFCTSIIKNSKYLIVFESGLGDNHKVWNKKDLAARLSANFDVVTYDRAGYGKSDISLVTRNMSKLSNELGMVVDKFSNGRKLILIGHSLGGLIIRDYAIKNPSKVAGILFIDPSHENYNRPSQIQENLIKFLVGIKSIGAKMEAEQLIEDAEYMSKLPNLPNVPVIVLTSMKLDETNCKADRAYNKTRQDWFDSHESLKKGLSNFVHITTIKSGHYIMNNEPDLIIDSVNLLFSKF